MDTLLDEALDTFEVLFAEAASAGEPDPTAMVVATTALNGHPSARMVLLKAHDSRGFVFYTHMDGRKGRELQSNPNASLLFFWPKVRNAVQIRIEGPVETVDPAEADSYFATRPRGSQLGAWASLQSERLPDRAAFDERYAKAEHAFEGREVPRPERWTGFRVRPVHFEFWYGAEFRLHDRIVYDLNRAGAWEKHRLYP